MALVQPPASHHGNPEPVNCVEHDVAGLYRAAQKRSERRIGLDVCVAHEFAGVSGLIAPTLGERDVHPPGKAILRLVRPCGLTVPHDHQRRASHAILPGLGPCRRMDGPVAPPPLWEPPKTRPPAIIIASCQLPGIDKTVGVRACLGCEEGCIYYFTAESQANQQIASRFASGEGASLPDSS